MALENKTDIEEKVTKTKKTVAKKTSAKKTTAKKVETSKAEEKKVEAAKKVKKKFEPMELIPVINIFAGTTAMVGHKTKNKYLWEGLGDVVEVEYQDLRPLCLNKKNVYMYDPLLIVDDEDFVEEFKDLGELYESLRTPAEIETILLHGDEDDLENLIVTSPKGIKETIKTMAETMLQEQTLDSVRKVRVIDRLLDTDLSVQLEMFN